MVDVESGESVCSQCGFPAMAGHSSTCPNQVKQEAQLGDLHAMTEGEDRRLATMSAYDILLEKFGPEEAEKRLALLPLEKQDKKTPKILADTIFNKEQIKKRLGEFDEIWKTRWNTDLSRNSKGDLKYKYFQPGSEESPFEKFSSKGWKIHIAFKKGNERDIAKLLYSRGLYFKVEGKLGTYFNGDTESGATVYIGAKDNRDEIVKFIEENAKSVLVPTYGSGTDEKVTTNIASRFDVQRSAQGFFGGKRKYWEDGINSQLGFGGLPILFADHKLAAKMTQELITANGTPQFAEVRDRCLPIFSQIYARAKEECIKDFGKEFVFGKLS